MADEWRRKEGFWGFLTYLFENSRYWIIVLIGVIFFGVWGFVHWNAEPGQQVVVWGLFQYTKRASQRPSGNNDWQVTPVSRQIESPTVIPSPTATPQQTPTASPIPVSHSTTPPLPQPTAIPVEYHPPTPTPILQPRYDIVVYVITDQNMVYSRLNGALLSLLQQQGKRAAQLSTHEIHSRSTFERMFGGDTNEMTQREFLQYGHYALLGKSSIFYVQNSSLENLITATISLDLRVISSHTGMIEHSLRLMQKGPGFSEETARDKAETQLIQELNRQFTQLLSTL